MSEATPFVYPSGRTALIVIDAINDFIAEEGKLWSYVSDVVTGVGMKENLLRLIAAARAAGVTVVHAPMETHPWDYDGWQNRALTHKLLGDMQIFEAGTWGAEFHPDFAPQPGDVVVAAHKGLDAFSGTDLDVQLRQRGIDHILITGMATNTCVESTGRDAFEKGYHLTFVSDACGAFTWEAHKASIELNWPRFAHAISTTDETIAALPQPVAA